MSWDEQGRQEHGWFGHGTSGADRERLQRIVFGVIGNLPAALRSRWDGMLSRGLAGRTANVLSRLSEASGLDAARFGELLPDTVGSIAAGRILAAARAAAAVRTPDDERAASAALADTVLAVGLDGWSRFVAGVEGKADNPATTAAVAQSQPPPDLRRDAISPVYPLETLIGVGAAGIAGGAAAATRAVGGALLRQIMPKPKPADAPGTPAKPSSTPSPAQTNSIAGKGQLKVREGRQGRHIIGSQVVGSTRSTLTADPQSLLNQFAGRGRQVGGIPVGQPGSKEVFDTGGDVIGIFRDLKGRSAPTTRGIIHYSKVGAHIVPSAPKGWVP